MFCNFVTMPECAPHEHRHTACACSAQITGVGSRRVIQVASVLIMVVAVIGEAAAAAYECHLL
jgi:hypothetical protein